MATLLPASRPSLPTQKRESFLDNMRKRLGQIRSSVSEEFGLQRSIFQEDLEEYAANHSDIPNQELEFRKQIKRFENDLQSQAFPRKVNSSLRQLLTSPKAYYESRDDLKEYTLEKELNRILYTLVKPDGTKLTEPEKIYEYVQSEPEEEKAAHEIIYRAANQSIFGDVIVALTSEKGLVRPQLQTGTFVEKCSITINLSKTEPPHVRAQCLVKLSVPDKYGERLTVACAQVTCYFCPATDKFQAGIAHMLPMVRLSEKDINGTAKFLSSMIIL